MTQAVKTLSPQIGDLLKFELDNDICRESVTLKSGTAYKVGMVVGKITVASATAALVAGGTGNGTCSAVTIKPGVQPGVYNAVFSGATKFAVYDPSGKLVGLGTTAVAFATQLGFTITAGGTAFVAGDSFTLTTAAGADAGKAKLSQDPADATAIDGAWQAYGVVLTDTDATSADQTSVVIARGPALVSSGILLYDASITTTPQKAAKQAQLLALGIITATSQ